MPMKPQLSSLNELPSSEPTIKSNGPMTLPVLYMCIVLPWEVGRDGGSVRGSR